MNGINYVYVDWDGNELTYKSLPIYDPETHILVEKKEAKMARLESELKLTESRIEAQNKALESIAILLLELKKIKDDLSDELEELKDAE